MKLHTYINEIADIARENDVDYGVAKDMFLANVEKGGRVQGQDWYEGAPDVDYAALQPHYQELVETGAAFMEAVQSHYKEIVALREQHQYAKAVALIGG